MNRVRSQNFNSRFTIGQHTKEHNNSISKLKNTDLNNKQQNAATMYQIKKESQFKQKYDKDSYLESIQRANQVVRSEHLQKKTMHEFKLN